MKTTIETITPEIAREYLSKMAKNRPVSKGRVKQYATAIRHGKWEENGDAIRFNSRGEFIDGQHRLLAVIETGISITCVVVRGIKEDAFSSIDTGKRRSGADVLGIEGYKNTALLASSLALVGRYYDDRNGPVHVYSNSEILDLCDKYPDIQPSVLFAAKNRNRKAFIRPAIVAAYHYLFSKTDREMSDLFWSSLINGAGLNENDPVLMLRERLQANAAANTKLTDEAVRAIVIKVWNAFYTGSPLKLLRYTSSEGFPKIA